jgi:hypothetical protein
LLARVLFDFHALSAKEISVKKNDVVIVKRPINHNWVEIEDPESGLKVISFACEINGFLHQTHFALHLSLVLFIALIATNLDDRGIRRD